MFAAIAVMGGLYAAASIPGSAPAEPSAVHEVFSWFSPTVHNILHIPAYALLAWTLFFCVDPHLGRRLGFPIVVLIAGSYGALMEWHQGGIPGRYASLTDVALNLVGAVAGWLLAARYADRGR